jgi:hypothetical protein
MGERHEHMSTPCAYEGVNGVNLRFVAQSFRQLLDQILSAPSSIDVLFRLYYSVVLNLRHFASLVVLSIVLTQDAFANSQSPCVRLKNPHEHGRTA